MRMLLTWNIVAISYIPFVTTEKAAKYLWVQEPRKYIKIDDPVKWIRNPVFELERKEYIKFIPKAKTINLVPLCLAIGSGKYILEANKLYILDTNIAKTLCML